MKDTKTATKNYDKKESRAAEIWRRLRKNVGAMFGLGVILIFATLAICANLIVPEETIALQNAAIRLQGPSAEHIFGTDELGRDIFTRVWEGTRISLYIAIVAVVIDVIFGLSYGLMFLAIFRMFSRNT